MTKRQKLTLVSLVGLAVAAGLPLVGWQWWATEAAGEDLAPDPKPVDTIQVMEVETIELPRSFTGVVRARQTSQLGFEIAGQLVELLVCEGTEVSEGDLLARLDTATLQVQMRVLEAQRDQADARLRELQAGPRVQTIEAARADVQVAEADASSARNTAERAESLHRRNSISREELDRAVYAAAAANARLAAAKQKLAELLEGTRPEQLDAARGAVAQLDASIEEIQVSLAKSELRAPFDGTVTARFHDAGTIVNPADPVIELQEARHLEAWIGLPAESAASLKPGAVRTLRVGNTTCPVTLRTLIRQIDPETRTQTAIFDVPANGSAELVAGQICKLELTVQLQERGFWIPTSALTQGVRGLWSVMVAAPLEEGWITAKRDVELVHTDIDRSFVKGTLRDGDRVIVDGLHKLVGGLLVAPSPVNAEKTAAN